MTKTQNSQIKFYFFQKKKGNGGVYPKWTFSPSYKEERNYVICKKMDENGGVWIKKLSESQKNKHCMDSVICRTWILYKYVGLCVYI